MKKLLSILLIFVLIISLVGCATETAEIVEVNKNNEKTDTIEEATNYSGTYIGFSWKGENKGEKLEEATQKIQTILVLDRDGIIVDANMLFWKKSGDYWYTSQDGTSKVSVDLSKTPTPATLGDDYKAGTSMFKIDTHDKMSFYSAKVDADGTTALLLVEPFSRYQFEIKMSSDYDYSTKVADVPINGTEDGFIPTVRTSTSGNIKPKELSDFGSKNIFEVHEYFHVMTEDGVFKDLHSNSTMQEVLEAVGVTFANGKPQETEIITGFHSKGGWSGNYTAIENYLIGKNAAELTSLVDWSVERWAGGVNEDNFFGVDVGTGATKTAQSSADTISGATVRMSRESTSFQRALVEAGIIEESEVIKGRF
jgi:hypothetical protein